MIVIIISSDVVAVIAVRGVTVIDKLLYYLY